MERRAGEWRGDILAMLVREGRECTVREVTTAVRGRRVDVEAAVRRLAVAGHIVIVGDGVKGDPLRCKLSSGGAANC